MRYEVKLSTPPMSYLGMHADMRLLPILYRPSCTAHWARLIRDSVVSHVMPFIAW